MKRKLHAALRLALLTVCLATGLTAHAQGFPASATNWTLPAGGEKYNGTDYSFREIAATTGAAYDLGSQSWTVMDINGDAKLDMVVYNENQAAGDAIVFNQNANPYWKVYLGTATGFSQTATNWALPPGGEKDYGITYGFRKIAFESGWGYDFGSQSWTVMDMNGDAKPDMVVYNEKQATDMLVFSQGATKYWKVYLNTGSGFSQTATNWTLPPGGEKDYGTDYSYRKIAFASGWGYDFGSQSYATMDMNGDNKPDMVVYNEKQATDMLVFTQGTTKYWKVYLNTGSGFSQTATNWTLPPGGEKDYDTDFSFRKISHVSGWGYDFGSQSYATMDMNGDSKPDMVVYNEKQADDMHVYTQGSTKYWKVYLSTGTGFSQTATNWTLPAGGEKDNGTNYSFRELYHSNGAAYDLGSQAWAVLDLNGDTKPDMVVYNENQAAGDALVYGTGANRYWKAYLNTGTGFALAATNWSLPAGGEIYAGTNYSFYQLSHSNGAAYSLGSQAWTVMDMNGDHKLDMVVYNENQTAGDELVFGTGSNRYWKVYLNTGTLSVPSQEAKQEIAVYPNPVSDTLYVKADLDAIGAPYAIFDVNGRIVKTGHLAGEISTVDLSAMAGGIYFLKVDGSARASVKISKE